MKAIIIGAGIGGTVAATALRQAGIEALVCEGAGPADDRGLFLTLGINGMRVLARLGLLDLVLRSDVVPTPVLSFESWTGKPLGAVSNGRLSAGVPSITIMRGALRGALAEGAVAAGADIQYGKRYVGHTETGSGVVARFAGGSELAGDVLIGADGIHSCVRSVMDPAAPGPEFTGLLNVGGVAAASDVRPTPDTMRMVWGKRAFFGCTVRPGGDAWWFANLGAEQEPAREALAAVDTARWKERLRELFADDPPFIRTLVDGTSRIDAFPIHDVPSLPAWSSGRVCLLGDAAHAVSPSAGQGASMAMEDAAVLAGCLRYAAAEPAAALARYESLRRDRAEKVVAMGRRRGAYKAPKSRAGLFLRDLAMPLALRFFATEKSLSWIHDYEIPRVSA